MEEIFIPTVEAMNREGRTFKGCLYFGLMLTADGPKVIEYNCRFGDPETQVVLPLLQSDLLEIMKATASQSLAQTEVVFSSQSACCVVMASEGYPKAYQKGFEITVEKLPANADIFVAGASLENGRLVTSGGRVLGATAVAGNLKTAIDDAYAAVSRVSFQNSYYRSDIGRRALEAE